MDASSRALAVRRPSAGDHGCGAEGASEDHVCSLQYSLGGAAIATLGRSLSTELTMPRNHRVCPWWLGLLLCCPLRHLLEKPETLLGPYVQPGMTVLEPGCGMGYFTLPLARMVGPQGRVVCVDLQPRMIRGLERRARRAGLLDRIDASTCTPEDLGIARWNGRIDLAVAIHMVHEVPDQRRLLDELHAALRPNRLLILIEPKGHVSPMKFEETLAVAREAGLNVREHDAIRRQRRAVLQRAG
jgi:2-polyprenyl-3-methyl-5-hydroxy-6-metoxy-1,4-benzoquinol methylase